MKSLSMLLVMLCFSGLVQSETMNTTASVPALTETTPALEACPAVKTGPGGEFQLSQADCCKGHKGVCGCRAGKIVCCDNTISPNCTCHSDWSSLN